jgi:hypothetical protein
MARKNKQLPDGTYEVTIKATLVVRVKSRNAYHAIAKAECDLIEQVAGTNIDVEEARTISSSSVED